MKNISEVEHELSRLWKYLYDYVGKHNKSKIFIAGGAIASLFHSETPRDIDIYFVDKSARDYCVDKITDIADGYTRNSFRLAEYNFVHSDEFIGDPEDVISKFDFLHTKTYFSFGENKLYISDDVLSAIRAKRILVNQRLKYPIRSMIRVGKLLGRDWTINQSHWYCIASQSAQYSVDDPCFAEQFLREIY